MLDLLKNVYLFDIDSIGNDIERIQQEYQDILDKKEINWEEINKARAILYFLGHIFTEKIAFESLERRIKFIQPKISLDNFLLVIDSQDKEILEKYKNNKKFEQLKKFYLIVKSIKNRVNRDSTYLDEETFNKKFKRLKPKDYF